MREGLYGVAELAELGGVSRRTVRYYVQEGLIPPPLGVGRGRHYDRRHLERLLLVKALQEQGLSLEDVRQAARRGAPALPPAPAPLVPPARRSSWTRIELLPGLELHVSSDWRVPAPARLAELAQWLAQHVRREGDASHE
jgi:DNA-binding transcriptional MerR regulator